MFGWLRARKQRRANAVWDDRAIKDLEQQTPEETGENIGRALLSGDERVFNFFEDFVGNFLHYPWDSEEGNFVYRITESAVHVVMRDLFMKRISGATEEEETEHRRALQRIGKLLPDDWWSEIMKSGAAANSKPVRRK